MKKIILILLILLFIPNLTLAWNDCPFGLINNPAPGSCWRFIDTDQDGFCDHSQPAPDKRGQVLSENDIEKAGSQVQKKKVGYEFFSVLIILSFLYFVSLMLAKRKIISLVTHRKIWNILLLVTFLISGISGLILVININYNLDIALFFNLLYCHVETGIAMMIIAIFHIGWHWQYFARIFQFKKKDQLEDK
jgi:hypothetical protein